MHIRIMDRERVKVQVQLEPRDLWLGVMWRTLHKMPNPWYTLHLYICIIPMLPLHITVLLKEGGKT